MYYDTGHLFISLGLNYTYHSEGLQEYHNYFFHGYAHVFDNGLKATAKVCGRQIQMYVLYHHDAHVKYLAL